MGHYTTKGHAPRANALGKIRHQLEGQVQARHATMQVSSSEEQASNVLYGT